MSERDARREEIKKAGWFEWYNPDYWCHERMITNPEEQDCTNYGASLDEAWAITRLNLYCGSNKSDMPEINKMLIALDIVPKICAYLDEFGKTK